MATYYIVMANKDSYQIKGNFAYNHVVEAINGGASTVEVLSRDKKIVLLVNQIISIVEG